MNRSLFGLVFALTALAGCASDPSANVDEEPVYRLVKVERMKKGGSFKPSSPPEYLMIRAEAALTGADYLNERGVKRVLSQVISDVRNRYAPDAITVFLFQSAEHVGRASSVGVGEWWPRGHSLSQENARNIVDKDTYVLTLKAGRLPKQRAATVSTRLSDSKRREIFAALVRSEDRADDEAQRAYPTDPSLLPMSKLRTYDFSRAVRLNDEKAKQLSTKYRGDLLASYRISDEELRSISRQSIEENWPLPD